MQDASTHKKLTSRLAHWGFDAQEPFLIAGPCSAESESQVLETARQLKSTGKASIFRAGVWKPRTRPGSFEGIGTLALDWMDAAKAETGLAMATEVANPWHVEEVLKHDIDLLWIGARTTVNPFYVQEIASALKGVDIPVLVKNPLHPDLGLWIGAIERFQKAGISKVAAIHRGFFTTKPSPFRNEPKWDMNFEMRRHQPDLPILCDPSHIAGNRNLLAQVAQTAMDINLDGLMIETHCTPEKALSDAEQQITPEKLSDLINGLTIKNEISYESKSNEKLVALRAIIDSLDHELISTLKLRFDHVQDIAQIKLDDNISVFQMTRWYDLMKNRQLEGEKHNLDIELMHELFSVIHKYSVKKQIETIQNKSNGDKY